MWRYTIRRLVLTLPVLLGVSLIIFTTMRILPGDLATARLGDDASPEAVAELREELGLDRPLYEQYASWIGNVIRFDFGNSLWDNRPISENIGRALPITLQLGVMAVIFAVIVAIPFGVASAAAQDRWPDYVLRLISITGLAIPNFWLATLVLTFSSIWFQWVPVAGAPTITDQPDNLIKFGLAAMLTGIASSAIILRMTRSMTLEVLRQDYIRTAYAKGLQGRTVMIRHALKNALIPVITLIGTQVGQILSGSIIIETVFGLPGLARVLIDGMERRDYPQVEASVLLLCLGFLIVNLAVDLLYRAIDPRIQY